MASNRNDAGPPRSQLDALLQIKDAVDMNGVLISWNKRNGANGGYCNFEGVRCDINTNVIEIFFEPHCAGWCAARCSSTAGPSQAASGDA